MPEFYVTFGVQYGDTVDAQAALDRAEETGGDAEFLDPHPSADWATGGGYLTVQYGASVTDVDPEALAEVRERAREAMWTWLNGVYAFDYDERPSLEHAPRGEVARMVLP